MLWNSVLVKAVLRSSTRNDKAQVRGAHLQAMLLQLGHIQLEALVFPIQLVSHHSHFTCVQVVHDLF